MSGLGLTHPEWVDGKRLWMDPVMADVIDKMHHGDPTKGWEGDPNLAVYFDGDEERWYVLRLEDDEQYRLVCRSKVGVPFDERFIEELVAHDERRRQIPLHEAINAHNEAVTRERKRKADEYMHEEAYPRLHHALNKDGA